MKPRIGDIGFLVIVVWLLPAGSACAHDSTRTSPTIAETFITDVKISLGDAGRFFTAPFRFSVRDWLYAAGVVGATVMVMTADDELKRMLGKDPAKRRSVVWEIPVRYGIVEFAAAGAAATYAAGLFAKNDELRITGRLLGESVTIAGTSILVLVLRYVAGRSRPSGDNRAWEFKWFERGVRSQSFPSGHSAVAFAMSTVLAERIGNTWATIGLYGMASLTSYSLVHANEHWVSDVLIGAGLGLGAGFVVLEREDERANPFSRESSRLQVYPLFNGLRIAYNL